MQKKLKLATLALFSCTLAMAQNEKNTEQNMAQGLDENAFTFSEAQLGEDDDMSSNVTILNSSSNVYAKDAGYLFSPVRFRYRAFNQKYNDVYINGAAMNDMETGQFRFSNIGGLNRFSRNVDFALPFEANGYSMTGMAGSNNYDFRAGSMQEGQYASVATTPCADSTPTPADSTPRDGPSQPDSPTAGPTADTWRAPSTTPSPISSACRRNG